MIKSWPNTWKKMRIELIWYEFPCTGWSRSGFYNLLRQTDARRERWHQLNFMTIAQRRGWDTVLDVTNIRPRIEYLIPTDSITLLPFYFNLIKYIRFYWQVSMPFNGSYWYSIRSYPFWTILYTAHLVYLANCFYIWSVGRVYPCSWPSALTEALSERGFRFVLCSPGTSTF